MSPLRAIAPRHVIVAVLLIVFPWLASDFWTVQIGGQTLLLGVIALSLMLLAGYGGMVSLAQMTLAGVAGYSLAVLGENSAGLGLGWPWWLAVPLGLLLATLAGALVGLIAVRTEGIYTIMITLAVAVAFFYFTRQNYAVFNGFNGFAGLSPPTLFGLDWRAPWPFYYLCLGVAAACYLFVVYLGRTPFGIALQAIRDNPRRMNALGFHVALHRVAAWAVAGFIAGLGGVLLVWFDGRISPGSIGVSRVIDILVIAVLGGLGHPVGAFLGALVFVLLKNFAIDFIAPERFNTLIGLAFLVVVLTSRDGLLGLWARLRPHLRPPRPDWGRRDEALSGRTPGAFHNRYVSEDTES